jgi:hypothetical protein
LRGRVREGGSFAGSIYDGLQYARTILQDIGIPESKYTVALGAEPTVTFNIVNGIHMLSAIEFDDQPTIVADEINDETSNRSLSPKT